MAQQPEENETEQVRPVRKEDEEDIDYLYYENDPNDESREWDTYFMEDKTLIKYGMLPIFNVPSYSHKYSICILEMI